MDIVKGEVKRTLSVPYENSKYLAIVIRPIGLPKGQPDLGRVADYVSTYQTYVDSGGNRIIAKMEIQPVVMKNVLKDVYNEAMKKRVPLTVPPQEVKSEG